MGSRTKNNSNKNKGFGELRKKLNLLESHLSETEFSMFQSIVRLEALTKLLVEKEYITQDEFQDYTNKVVDYYKSETFKQETNTEDSIHNKELKEGGKLNIKVSKESKESESEDSNSVENSEL